MKDFTPKVNPFARTIFFATLNANAHDTKRVSADLLT
jgi:hypothetical protein